MKKLTLALSIFITTVSALFANPINMPRRYVELGIDTEFGVSNNYFTASKVLKKDFVLDLPEMADKMPNQGLVIDANLKQNFYIDVNLANGLRVKVNQGIESDFQINIFKELFDFLAKGNKINEPLNFGSKGDGSAYAFFDCTYGMVIKGFRFEVKPAVFFPLAHVKTKKVVAEFTNKDTGAIGFDVGLTTDIYTAFDAQKFENGFDFSDVTSFNGVTPGFDLEFSVEHEIFNSLTAMLFMRTPIVPGSLNNKTELTIDYSYEGPDVFSIISGSSDKKPEFTKTTVYSSDKHYQNRPFHTGIKAAWRPFGTWCTFNGMVGFGVVNPFTADAEGYMEYNFNADLLLIHVFGFKFVSSYQDRIYTHSLGINFNFRVLQLDFGVGFQGADFFQSFGGTGAFAAVGLRMGF